MFNEENTVEQVALDILCDGVELNRVAEELSSHSDEVGIWHFGHAENLRHQNSDILYRLRAACRTGLPS